MAGRCSEEGVVPCAEKWDSLPIAHHSVSTKHNKMFVVWVCRGESLSPRCSSMTPIDQPAAGCRQVPRPRRQLAGRPRERGVLLDAPREPAGGGHGGLRPVHLRRQLRRLRRLLRRARHRRRPGGGGLAERPLRLRARPSTVGASVRPLVGPSALARSLTRMGTGKRSGCKFDRTQM